MIIDCISDLHGHFPKLEGGDLLIVAGDLTARDSSEEHIRFASWMANQEYRHRVFIGGNHDNQMVRWEPMKLFQCDYLFDSGTEFEGLKIWGTPWTKKFKNQNEVCMSFTVDTDQELAEKWALIPDDTNILITHEPAWGFGDRVFRKESRTYEGVGSRSLLEWIGDHPSIKLHVCGHVHEGYGMWGAKDKSLTMVNASILNEHYEAVNKPIRVIL